MRIRFAEMKQPFHGIVNIKIYLLWSNPTVFFINALSGSFANPPSTGFGTRSGALRSPGCPFTRLAHPIGADILQLDAPSQIGAPKFRQNIFVKRIILRFQLFKCYIKDWIRKVPDGIVELFHKLSYHVLRI
jgi:hypothetical protein